MRLSSTITITKPNWMSQIQEVWRFADEMAAKAGESLAVKKLKAMGKLPST